MESNNHQSRALAQHLWQLRADRGLSLLELASKSGVSRATLSRIENAEVSPTAETLGRLASALALPMSQLLTPFEPEFIPFIARDQQSLWSDPAHGFTRRSVSPPAGALKLEMIEGEIAANQCISYQQPAFPGHEHHLLLLSGALVLTVDAMRYELVQGDCLRYRLRGASRFETHAQAARYIIAMA